MIRLVALFVVVLLSSRASAQHAFPFHNKPGAHSIGFRTIEQSDPSRTYKGRARPIQTAIWYPAQQGGQPIRYDDYLQLLGWDDDFARTPAERDKVLADWLKIVTGNKPAAELAAERRDPRWAVRDARALPGKFPVVIYSPSLSSNVFENAEMMEFLASHGYLVIASPALGIEGRTQKADLAHAEAQAADIRFLVDYVQTLPQADASRIAVAGFSWGGMANVLAAAQDNRIKALISLDGSVRYAHAMLSPVPYLKPAALKTPLLYLAQRPQPFERGLKYKPDTSGSILQKMTGADVYMVTMYAMEHVYFATSYLRLDPLEFKEFSREEVAQSHSLAARYVLNFLNGALKGERAGFDYLMKKSEQVGVAPHTTYSQFFPAKEIQ